MLSRYFLIVLMIGLFFTACQNKKQSLKKEIESKEKELYSDTAKYNISINLAHETANLYREYASEFPEDTLSADYLFNSVELYKFIGKYDIALGLLDTIYQKYPDYERRPYCLFLQGFIYENNLEELEKARAKYQAFLKKYPGHELKDDVEFSLKNLGKSPEEVIKALESQGQPPDSLKQPADTAQAPAS